MISTNFINCLFMNHGGNKKNYSSQSNSLKLSGSEDFKSVLNNESNKSRQENQDNLINPKIQEKINLDIKRIASLMGIGPQTLMTVIGKLDIDPKYYNFKVETNIDRAVNSIAGYFGISPMTMLAVFDKLGIDPNDLVDKEKTGKIICKLKEFFGLSLDQEKELADILAEYVEKDK